jgi:hypothetical protein
MLREPVDMIHSLYSEMLFSLREGIEDFADAMRIDNERQQGAKRAPARSAPIRQRQVIPTRLGSISTSSVASEYSFCSPRTGVQRRSKRTERYAVSGSPTISRHASRSSIRTRGRAAGGCKSSSSIRDLCGSYGC